MSEPLKSQVEGQKRNFVNIYSYLCGYKLILLTFFSKSSSEKCTCLFFSSIQLQWIGVVLFILQKKEKKEQKKARQVRF